ncbi:hypothetical protein Leryth_018356 [Lithospermum erythrorhizon]|nr:hypothetical protein Leryth_018356 [Lithospermum erythrorhizon]
MNQCNCPISVDYDLCLARCSSPGLPSRPLPYIGLYIATATIVCFVAVSADLCHGVLHNKPWIPSEYFKMNAATLTLLAVAVKLPLDITTEMFSDAEVVTKCGSLIVIISAMATFMPSLASMHPRDIWQNMVALASASKYYLELKYHKLHEQISGLRLDARKERFCVKSLKKRIQFYWVMAKTGNPVFVMARSITCLAASIISGYGSLSYLFSTLFNFRQQLGIKWYSDYQWSIPLIQVSQLFLCFGCVATLLLRSKFIVSSITKKTCISSFKYACRLEQYWTKGLKELKHRHLVCRIANHTCRKIIEDVKIFALNICITMQIIIVMLSKLVVLISYLVIRPLYFCFHHLRITICSSNNNNESELDIGDATELARLKGYVLLLEGELELPPRIVKGICTALDQVIQMGAKQQKGHLLELISGECFILNSLIEFDEEEVESLHAVEPPRCWSLSIANLTSIGVALSTIGNDEKRKLLHSVDEGMFYIRAIEKNLDSKKKLENIGKAADVVWNGVELKFEWLEKDIQAKIIQGKNAKEILKRLAKISKDIVMKFKTSTTSSLLENPLYWPKKVISANSMYRVSQTLLFQCDNGNLQSDEQVFNKIVNLIASIFVVGLTNLPLAISSKCYSSSIEERENSVKEAARLLGATEKILQFLSQQIDLPILQDGDGAPYIDEWRAFIKEQNAMSSSVSKHNSPVSDRLIRSKSI